MKNELAFCFGGTILPETGNKLDRNLFRTGSKEIQRKRDRSGRKWNLSKQISELRRKDSL